MEHFRREEARRALAGPSELVAAVAGEAGTGPVDPPHAPVEEVAGRPAAAEADEDPPGPWGPLLAACRRLCESLTDQPEAAVRPSRCGGGRAAVTVHDRWPR